ncbi:MarR family winged helix-turn-helix transcriptional regulator [Janthinobacterium agaricidamnosum]|nr:MarR family winged helix-turn-helix transcriptional regulator [Janthinobacterium agaricidamnosum]
MEDLGPLACHCSATRQMSRYISKLYERHFAPSNITTTQYGILNFLEQHREQGMGMNELAALLLTDRTTLLRALKPLLQKELVISTAHPEERRRHVLSISAAGLAKIDQARPLWLAAQAEYEALVGAQHARILRHDFLSITGAL